MVLLHVSSHIFCKDRSYLDIPSVTLAETQWMEVLVGNLKNVNISVYKYTFRKYTFKQDTSGKYTFEVLVGNLMNVNNSIYKHEIKQRYQNLSSKRGTMQPEPTQCTITGQTHYVVGCKYALNMS